jgi:hypothetical protein
VSPGSGYLTPLALLRSARRRLFSDESIYPASRAELHGLVTEILEHPFPGRVDPVV